MFTQVLLQRNKLVYVYCTILIALTFEVTLHQLKVCSGSILTVFSHVKVFRGIERVGYAVGSSGV